MTQSASLPVGCNIRPAQEQDAWRLYQWMMMQMAARTNRQILIVILVTPVLILATLLLFWSLSGAEILTQPKQLFQILLASVIAVPIGAIAGWVAGQAVSLAIFFSQRAWQGMWLIESDRRLIGYARITPDSAYTTLDILYIAPTHQRRGIGSAFVQWLVQHEEPKAIYVLCTRELQRFYNHLGFFPIRDRDIPVHWKHAVRVGLFPLQYSTIPEGGSL